MSRTTCRSFFAAAAMVAVVGLNATTRAATIAQWTVEVPTTPADLNNSTNGPNVAASTGSGTLTGVHVSAGSDWSTPSGNGSAESFSVNEWGIAGSPVGNYFEFSTSTAGGYEQIKLRVDHTSSNTGPRDFKIQYSTGGPFVDSGTTYSVVANAAPNSWTSGTYLPIHTLNFDLSAITALNNQAAVAFRLVQNSLVSANAGAVAIAGTSRVDNVTVFGNRAPTVNDATINGVNASVPGTVQHTFTGSDPDSDPLTWSGFVFDSYTPAFGGSGVGPAVAATFDPGTQLFDWNSVGSPRGIYKWLVTASDGVGGLSDQGSLTVEVVEVPEPATLALVLSVGLGLIGCGWRRRR